MRSAHTVSARNSIVRHALRLFGERGIEGTSLRRRSRGRRRCRLLVVHHFAGKQGLIAAACAKAVRAFADDAASRDAGINAVVCLPCQLSPPSAA